jgi:hypothetical protein
LKPWVASLAAAGLLAAITWMTLHEGSGVSCEVCMDYQGGSNCAVARAPVREEALQGAIMSACSTISHGVTETLGCQRTEPRELHCSP